jgi:hypothetical protein
VTEVRGEPPENLTRDELHAKLEAWVEAQVLLKDPWKITEALWEALEGTRQRPQLLGGLKCSNN